jgi:predicted ATPase
MSPILNRPPPSYRGGMAIPDRVRATVLERIDRMSFFERTILMHAAVIGPRFDLYVLVESTRTDELRVRTALERARMLDLVVVDAIESRSYAFRHALTRDIVYAELLQLRIRPIHRRIARALERGPRAERLEALAFHWWAAGDARRSLKYNELAGDNASALYAFEDARAFYARALRCVESNSTAATRLNEKVRATSAVRFEGDR